MNRREATICALIIACACILVVGWVVLTTFVFPAPKPFDSWSPYAEEYYELSGPIIGSGLYEYVKAIAEEIAMQTDDTVNVGDIREAICRVWIETGRRMPSDIITDYAYTKGFVSNATIVPDSTIDTMEKAYLALEIWEIFIGNGYRERVIELLALDQTIKEQI